MKLNDQVIGLFFERYYYNSSLRILCEGCYSRRKKYKKLGKSSKLGFPHHKKTVLLIIFLPQIS